MVYRFNNYDRCCSGAYLSGADLGGTGDLRDAAILHNADLIGTDLRGADLSGAQGVTKDQLEQQAANLEGATMP